MELEMSQCTRSMMMAPLENKYQSHDKMSDSMTMLPLILKLQLIQHSGNNGPNKDRQEGPHAHQAVFDSTNHLYAVDLGLDAVFHCIFILIRYFKSFDPRRCF